jgi:LysM repeat protein
MQNLRNSILFFLLLFTLAARAQNTEVILNYINTYKDLAIQEMQRTGVPAAIKLAQGIHETTAGTSELVQQSNNHFGIKCKDTWTGASVFHDDDSRGECFRKYSSAIESYRDHSDFLKSSDRYSFLFNLDPTDYKDWAYGLKRAGYATNPHYPQIIIGLIEDYHLQDYTLMALGKIIVPANAIVKATIENGQKQTDPSFVSVKQDEPIKQTEKIIEKASYPEGTEFRINDTRVIYAKKGTSFLAIAQEYNVPLARLFEFNDMPQSEIVNKDQLIYLQRKRKTGNNEFHTIQVGETLYDIAQQEAIRLETLLEYNLLKQDMKPAIGEQLNLRTKAAVMPRLALKENYSLYSTPAGSTAKNTYTSENTKSQANNSVQTAAVYYTVHPKETIYAISKKYNVNIDDIVKWNQLSGYDLKTGQQLKIYK